MTFLVFTRAGVAQESGLNVVILKALKLFCALTTLLLKRNTWAAMVVNHLEVLKIFITISLLPFFFHIFLQKKLEHNFAKLS